MWGKEEEMGEKVGLFTLGFGNVVSWKEMEGERMWICLRLGLGVLFLKRKGGFGWLCLGRDVCGGKELLVGNAFECGLR